MGEIGLPSWVALAVVVSVLELSYATAATASLTSAYGRAQTPACKTCMRIVNSENPTVKEYDLNGDRGTCRIQQCTYGMDICYHSRLSMSSTTIVHIHLCGVSQFTDDYICQLFNYELEDIKPNCTVNRCKSGDCEVQRGTEQTDLTTHPQITQEPSSGNESDSQEELIINDTEMFLGEESNKVPRDQIESASSSFRVFYFSSVCRLLLITTLCIINVLYQN